MPSFGFAEFAFKELRAKSRLILFIFILLSVVLFAADWFLVISFEVSEEPLLKWLISTNILANIGIGLFSAVVVTLSLESLLANKLASIVSLAIIDSDDIEKYIPKDAEEALLTASLKRMSKGDQAYADCQKFIVMNHQKRFQNDNNVLVRDLKYEFAVKDIVDNGKLPKLPQEYFHIDAIVKYSRRKLPRIMRIKAVMPNEDDASSPIADPDFEFVWVLVADINEIDPNILKPRLFRIKEISIRGSVLHTNKIKPISQEIENGFSYEVDLADYLNTADLHLDDFPYLIEIKFEALQLKKYGFVAANVKYFSSSFTAELDYSEASFINNVWGINHVAGTEFNLTDHKGDGNRYRVRHNGWIVPESGVTISWGC